ncbi:MAG: Rieske (2Fe-2S) protein [Myxococcota bacterium]
MIELDDEWPELPPDYERFAEYRRDLDSSVEGVWLNVLDYAHLPHLHAHSFASAELLGRGKDCWRARVGVAPASVGQFMTLELRVSRARSQFVTRTLEGVGGESYILTHVHPDPTRPTTHASIHVEFFGPPTPAYVQRGKAQAYLRLYARLWDEDEEMAVGLLAFKGQRPWRPQSGTQLPLPNEERTTRDGTTALAVHEVDGELWVHPTACPHMGGPLGERDADGRVRCPWHGYSFSVPEGASEQTRLRLPCHRARRCGDHLELE